MIKNYEDYNFEDYTIEGLLRYSVDHKLMHIPSALSSFSYLKILLPILKDAVSDVRMYIGKPFGSQAYYYVWEKMGEIEYDDLSYGVDKRISFVDYSEETLGNALGVALGATQVELMLDNALCRPDLIWCNIGDGVLQMGATLEAISFANIKKKRPLLLTIDFNSSTNLSGYTEKDYNYYTYLFQMNNWNVHQIEIEFEYDESIFNCIKNIINMICHQDDISRPTVIFFKTIKGCGVKEMLADPFLWQSQVLQDENLVTYKRK